MRRHPGLMMCFMVLLVVLGSASSGVLSPGASGLAQEATPSASDSGSAASSAPRSTANPAIGDEVRYITESGSEVARLRIADLAIPWEEYGEYYEPDPGTVYERPAIGDGQARP
ncbi:MAG: hypothetical protein M3440_14715, partial [Chloroflexota bacterium]|nr:hypothetical protein [Chloroflexota bacterium]